MEKGLLYKHVSYNHVALQFPGSGVTDNVSTVQRTKAKRDQEWVSENVR